MKTLDEVIKALEMCTADKCVCFYGCPYSHLADGDDGCEYHAIPEMQKDALSYLKMYRSDQIQHEADRKNWQDQYSHAVEDFKAATAKHLEALKELKKQDRQKWISVSDRMPETDKIVAIRCVTKKGVVTWNRAYWDGKFWHGSGSFAGVTHWMRISTEVEG